MNDVAFIDFLIGVTFAWVIGFWGGYRVQFYVARIKVERFMDEVTAILNNARRGKPRNEPVARHDRADRDIDKVVEKNVH